jgi:hypothetical protein
MLEKDEHSIVRWEFPLSKIIPKKLYEAQKSEEAMLNDSKLFATAEPDSLDWRLRIRYCSLLQKFMDPTHPKDSVITQEDIYRDICSYEVFKRRVDIPAKAVFITRRIGSYLEDQDSLLTAFSARLWEVASAPILREDGRIDIEAAKMLHKSIQILLDRKFGQAIQRNITANIGHQDMNPETIEAQIRELEALDGQK